MITCTFLGHTQLYNSQLQQQVYETIRKLARKTDAVEFLFMNSYNQFEQCCLAAAIEAKHSNHTKKITLTLISDTDTSNCHLLAPFCFFDRLIKMNDSKANRRNYSQRAFALRRALMLKSDVLISYVYPDLFDGINSLFRPMMM